MKNSMPYEQQKLLKPNRIAAIAAMQDSDKALAAFDAGYYPYCPLPLAFYLKQANWAAFEACQDYLISFMDGEFEFNDDDAAIKDFYFVELALRIPSRRIIAIELNNIRKAAEGLKIKANMIINAMSEFYNNHGGDDFAYEFPAEDNEEGNYEGAAEIKAKLGEIEGLCIDLGEGY